MLRLGMDAKAPGRAFSSGSKGTHVWDFLLFKSREGRGAFTGYPHFAIGISSTMVDAMLTVPNAVVTPAFLLAMEELSREFHRGLRFHATAARYHSRRGLAIDRRHRRFQPEQYILPER